MDKYLRLFIKYQPLTIVIFTLIMVVIFTPVMAHYDTNDIENMRFGGAVAIVFGVTWFLVVTCLFVAIQKEDKRFIYPYIVLFGFELLLLLLRELYVTIIDGIYVELLTLKMLVSAIIVPYVFASLFALHRLFTVDPIVTQHREGFVRFDRNELAAGVETTSPGPHFSPPAPDYVRQI